jgi:hypothetical protein
VSACLAFDLIARWVFAGAYLTDGERQESKVIVVRPVAAWRARPTITDAAEVVGRLLKTVIARRNTFRKHCTISGDVIDGPMVPGASGRVGIIAKQDKATNVVGNVGPSQGWRQILALASEATRDHRAVRECRGRKAH